MYNEGEITIFAETTYRNQNKIFGIKQDDRRRHMYLIGKTGMGKSTILENMIIEDIRAGHGVAVVDPHGDLAEKVIQFIPNDRINDVINFNPADYSHPIAFNVVEQVDAHLRHLVASGLIGVFQKLWADSWGPRLEYILRNAILAILDYPGSTLLGITRMLSDKGFRKKVIEKIQDPVVKAFWVNEFAGYNDKFASEAVSPIQNKVGQFLSSSLIRNIVGQVKSTIDMRKIMDDGKILVLNLSKGRIGEDNSSLLGAMMITKIQLAAMSRVDVPEKERKDFYLYVDEFQNFTSDSFANILSEARKYHLNLILAHQYIEQLGDTVKNAVFGNVGTLIVFRVGAADAEAIVPEFIPTFTAEDIVNLPKYEIYLKLMIDGIASEPFSARGLPPLRDEEITGNLDKIIKVSRERYAQPREEVEDKINRWHENESDEVNNASEKKRKPKTERNLDPSVYKYSANCSSCGKETKLSFEPDGIRPIYCKDCLSKAREDKLKEVEDRRILKKKELKIVNKPSDPKKDDQININKKNEIKEIKETQNFKSTAPVDISNQTQKSTASINQIINNTGAKKAFFNNSKPAQLDNIPRKEINSQNVGKVKEENNSDNKEKESISLSQLTKIEPVKFGKARPTQHTLSNKPVNNIPNKHKEDKKQYNNINQTNNTINNTSNNLNNKLDESEIKEGDEITF